MNTTAVIVAAGAGTRMNATVPKAFMDLAGRPLFEHSLETFQQHAGISFVVLVVPEAMVTGISESTGTYGKVAGVVPGGVRRQDSVMAGLELAGEHAGGDDIVLIHDAARPLVPPKLITSVIEAASRSGAAVPGLPPVDTIRTLDGTTLDRNNLIRVQTPQGFRYELLHEAFRSSKGEDVTDDAALVQEAGHRVEIVPGEPRNFKVTTPDDLRVAAAYLA